MTSQVHSSGIFQIGFVCSKDARIAEDDRCCALLAPMTVETHSTASVRTPTANKWKYKPDSKLDAAIRDAYRNQRLGDRHALKRLSQEVGWPPYAIYRRGAELGVTRAKEYPWSAAEEDLLERFGHLTPSGIQRRLAAAGYSRSVAAIQIKLNRNRIKQNLDGYSATRLADAFGVDVHKILSWIRRGLLKAQPRGTDRVAAQGGDIWWISQRNAKRFVLRAPEEIDLARVEKIWFLDLLTSGKLGEDGRLGSRC